MKIGILVKQVPDTATKIRIRDDKRSIATEDVKWIVNPYDEFAIEEALKLKTALNAGEVVVFSAGPQRAQEAMRTAMAMGADRGVHLSDAAFEGSDTLGLAKAFKAAVQAEGIEILFTGKLGIDNDNGQLTQVLAELLGWSHVQPVVKFELGADKKRATVQRMVGGGAKEVIDVAFPAIFGCDKGLNEPRYASLPGIMKAKSKPLKAFSLADSKLAATEVGESGASVLLASMEPPPERKAGQILKGDASETAKKLIDLLRNEAKAI